MKYFFDRIAFTVIPAGEYDLTISAGIAVPRQSAGGFLHLWHMLRNITARFIQLSEQCLRFGCVDAECGFTVERCRNLPRFGDCQFFGGEIIDIFIRRISGKIEVFLKEGINRLPGFLGITVPVIILNHAEIVPSSQGGIHPAELRECFPAIPEC